MSAPSGPQSDDPKSAAVRYHVEGKRPPRKVREALRGTPAALARVGLTAVPLAACGEAGAPAIEVRSSSWPAWGESFLKALRVLRSLSAAAATVDLSLRAVTSARARSKEFAQAVEAALSEVTGALERTSVAVALGEEPAEEVLLLQVDPASGAEQTLWLRRTYRKDPKLLAWLLGRRLPEDYGRATVSTPEGRHVVRIILDDQGAPPDAALPTTGAEADSSEH